MQIPNAETETRAFPEKGWVVKRRRRPATIDCLSERRAAVECAHKIVQGRSRNGIDKRNNE
ncbi:MAG: hypothetical protein A2289_24650 [Deltaproteobacteria bacterium RIFOXYA12_FULL_58_15]|nr:MAG: hypothetical protein A2289_24650 [Deltaproteobacteria bacterium RIFOXYA12_FULL_58_15]OGR12701.1 MAG: hypothetical protein A2341_07770 [Deltaproteobacteria bacterium RIFOXYB12_FULL_58_9]